MQNSSSQRGFTVIELLLSIVFLLVAGTVVAWQTNNIRVSVRDDQRKVAINSFYYGLEEVYYKENGFYPQKLDKDTLRSVDEALLTDPRGNTVGDASSDYRYEPAQCSDGKCRSYTLRADLENEDDYVKSSRDTE